MQQRNKDRVFVRNFAARIDSIKHGHNRNYCSYLVYRPRTHSWPSLRTYRLHFPSHSETQEPQIPARERKLNQTAVGVYSVILTDPRQTAYKK